MKDSYLGCVNLMLRRMAPEKYGRISLVLVAIRAARRINQDQTVPARAR